MLGAMLGLLAVAHSGFVHHPTSAYRKLKLIGFTVLVSPDAVKLPETEPALALLEAKLRDIEAMIPKKPLGVLHKIKIFVEANNPDFPCACYHPAPEWLKAKGYNLDKENSIEISTPKNFVDWIGKNQPLMVLHELAHGYHDLAFTYDDPYILSVFKNAKVSKAYELVDYNMGGKRRHYGLNDQMEYFAEATEAYFNGNDFFPFTREQLRQFDPSAYDMVQKLWEVPDLR